MKKIEWNNRALDRAIDYLTELENLEDGKKPASCGMCEAASIVVEGRGRNICGFCPLKHNYLESEGWLDSAGFPALCDDRDVHLVSIRGIPVSDYDESSKASRHIRIKAIAEMINKYTWNRGGWKVVVK